MNHLFITSTRSKYAPTSTGKTRKKVNGGGEKPKRPLNGVKETIREKATTIKLLSSSHLPGLLL